MTSQPQSPADRLRSAARRVGSYVLTGLFYLGQGFGAPMPYDTYPVARGAQPPPPQPRTGEAPAPSPTEAADSR